VLKIYVDVINEEQDNFIKYYDILYNLGKVIYIRSNKIIGKAGVELKQLVFNKVKLFIF
jgi:hypothetical protein